MVLWRVTDSQSSRDTARVTRMSGHPSTKVLSVLEHLSPLWVETHSLNTNVQLGGRSCVLFKRPEPGKYPAGSHADDKASGYGKGCPSPTWVSYRGPG